VEKRLARSMKYLNLSSSINQHPSMMKATPEQKGIWLELQCYCHQQMNSGMILDCASWPDAMWLRITGATGAVMAHPSPLWRWTDAGILIVEFYNAVAEENYKRKLMLGRRFAMRRWESNHERKIVKIPSSNSGKPRKDNAS